MKNVPNKVFFISFAILQVLLLIGVSYFSITEFMENGHVDPMNIIYICLITLFIYLPFKVLGKIKEWNL